MNQRGVRGSSRHRREPRPRPVPQVAESLPHGAGNLRGEMLSSPNNWPPAPTQTALDAGARASPRVSAGGHWGRHAGEHR